MASSTEFLRYNRFQRMINRLLDPWLPHDPYVRFRLRMWVIRLVAVSTLFLGLYYFSFRYTRSINWEAPWFALPLLAAETYSFIGTLLFVMTLWKPTFRRQPPPLPEGRTVDVFITTYNEPLDLVRLTVEAALRIRYPHRTYVLDDGDRPEFRALCATLGVGYITRGPEWEGKPRHAKAGNVNNALLRTSGEFILILDADQVPAPEILDRTLGYFRDPKVAFVQTPQYFYNVSEEDPFGSQAPLFYGPIQQGKDGWNAAFFTGTNAVLRREALLHLGIWRYVRQTERRILRAISELPVRMQMGHVRIPRRFRHYARRISRAAVEASQALREGEMTLEAILARFNEEVEDIQREIILEDLKRIAADLKAMGALEQQRAVERVEALGVEADTVEQVLGTPEEVVALLEAPLSEAKLEEEIRRQDLSAMSELQQLVGVAPEKIFQVFTEPFSLLEFLRGALGPAATSTRVVAVETTHEVGQAIEKGLWGLLYDLSEVAAPPMEALGLDETVAQALRLESGEALDIQALETVSITEDMATALQLHALGWKSVFHPEILAYGLAPEDLGSVLQQRLRWAVGTLQVFLHYNPLTLPGLTLGQRLQYFMTIYSYFSGFASVVYLLAPAIYLLFGIAPVVSFAGDFLVRIVPYLLMNQLMFMIAAWGMKPLRGEQYNLALFPLWIQAVVIAFGGRRMGFRVTPKERRQGVYLHLVVPQLAVLVLLLLSLLFGLVALGLGWRTDAVGILINVFWAAYDVFMLQAIVRAAVSQPVGPRWPPARVLPPRYRAMAAAEGEAQG